MASIAASTGTFGKKIESNTHTLEEALLKLLNEIRRLRLGDDVPAEADIL